MTKLELSTAVSSVMAEHKAPKKLIEEMNALMADFLKSGKAEKKAEFIRQFEFDGNIYNWCVRHEKYEIISNFNPKDMNNCLLHKPRITALTKIVVGLQNELQEAAEMGADNVKEIALELKNAKEIRGARYDINADKADFPSVEGYDYDALTFDTIPA